MSSDESSFQVFCTITAQNGARVPVTVSKSTTSTELRTIVSDATKIPLASLRLIFRGKMIKDDATITVVEEYKVEPDCVLHCMGKPVESSTTSSTNSSSNSNTITALPTAVSVPTATATPAAPLVPPPAQQDPFKTALQTLRSSNSPSVYTTAVTTLEKILTNIADNPMEEKYRKVKVQNAAFQNRLGGLNGGDAAMKAVGFEVSNVDGAPHYQLNASADAWPKLLEHKTAVAAAAQEAKRATASVPPPMGGMGGMPSMMPGGGGGFPNMPPPGGMPNMNDPMMQSAMSNMMSNPENLSRMLQNPMVQQMIQNDPNVPPQMRQSIQQISQNPAMLQQVSQMMSDPNMRQQMQNMMASGGAGGPNFGGMPNFGAPPQPTSNNNNNNASPPPPRSGNDQDQTEEDMIAEAIRRSLEES